MAINVQRGIMRAMRIRNHAVTVLGTEDFTPGYRRIHFSAPELVAGLEVYPTMWLRLWVPSLEPSGPLRQRGYTFVDVDATTGTFALDFVIHDPEGPAGHWAAHATAGDEAEVALTPSVLQPDLGLKTYVLAGDTSALPAINSLIDYLPSDADIRVFLEQPAAGREGLPLADGPNLVIRWLDPEPDGGAVARAIAAENFVPGSTWVWAAGERALAKAVTTLLRTDLRVERANAHSQPYWTRGKATG